ncbi:MAG: hypothetical protein NXI27_25945 [Alphaproteobacteria bacterium]|nr:hypothetical protein [Alphaproteobacteria bacterium]
MNKQLSKPHRNVSSQKPDISGSGTPLIRDAIIQAAIEAGDGSLIDYLRRRAATHPSAFLTLLGKVLPLQVTGVDGDVIKTRIEFSIVDPKRSGGRHGS